MIKNVQSCGLKVVATVCDQGATNMAAINALLRDTREMCIRKGEDSRVDILILILKKITLYMTQLI